MPNRFADDACGVHSRFIEKPPVLRREPAVDGRAGEVDDGVRPLQLARPIAEGLRVPGHSAVAERTRGPTEDHDLCASLRERTGEKTTDGPGPSSEHHLHDRRRRGAIEKLKRFSIDSVGFLQDEHIVAVPRVHPEGACPRNGVSPLDFAHQPCEGEYASLLDCSEGFE